MTRKPIGWRRWILCIGFVALGLMFLATAAGAFLGVDVAPVTRHVYARAHRIDSPAMRVAEGTFFSILGLSLVGLGYRAFRRPKQ
jgi:hypothetical protein